MAADYRGWLQEDPNKAWALGFVGNDYNNPDTFGIDTQALHSAYKDSPMGTAAEDQARYDQAYNTLRDYGRQYGGYPQVTNGAVTGGTSTGSTADDISFLNDQENALNGLLGRNQIALNQGLTQNEDDYNTQTGEASRDKERAYETYAGQRQDQIKGRETAKSTNRRNAGSGFRSLAQIIGRASGTGSSAFRDLLPNVVGKDLSGKQRNVAETFGTNLQGIDKKQSEYDLNFENSLKDLLRQKKLNEGNKRTTFENNRIDTLDKIRQVQAQRVQAQGGGYAAVKAAQGGTNAAIENSRNAIEGFFNQFRTPYVRQQAVVGTPELSNYTTDRASINAKNSGQNPDNPYAAILRKKLQQQA